MRHDTFDSPRQMLWQPVIGAMKSSKQLKEGGGGNEKRNSGDISLNFF